ncbi:MAG: hypothetical protein MJ133_07255 [Lachnospiraceae bacterium]|nr:hypothetical protein [Lachnospiraceae bacterium]
MSEMNVSNVSSTYTGYQTGAAAKNDKETKPVDEKKAVENSGVVYEKSSEPEKKGTYTINKMSAEDRAALVQQLKQDEIDRRSQLSSLVQKMFQGQAGVSNLSQLFSPENLKNVSIEDIEQAKKDVAEDGYWGVKQTSQRLFDFASALAGDDVDKMKEMQKALEKGYKQAEEAWGGELPEISKKTLEAANKLFEDYYASKNQVEE